MVTVSVVTPVRNGEAYLRRTVDSILSQEGDFHLEYIVRDGASTDGTLDLLAEYGDRLAVVSEADGSPQAAINAGLAQATGDICCWLNADDVYAPGAIQTVVQAFARRPDRSWLYGHCRIMGPDDREIRRPITLYKHLLGTVYSRQLLLVENYVNQPATFWRRSLWEQVGGLDLSLKAAFDYDLWLRFAEVGPALALPNLLAHFRRHPGSISENHFERQFRESLEVCRRHGNWAHAALHDLAVRKTLFVYRLLARA